MKDYKIISVTNGEGIKKIFKIESGENIFEVPQNATHIRVAKGKLSFGILKNKGKNNEKKGKIKFFEIPKGKIISVQFPFYKEDGKQRYHGHPQFHF